MPSLIFVRCITRHLALGFKFPSNVMYQSRRQDFDRDLDSATMQKCVSQPKDVDAVELHAICPSGKCSECLVNRKLTTISHLEWCMSLLYPRHQQL
jgi:hypothetical protein